MGYRREGFDVLSGRMLIILEYITKHPETSYRKIAEDLGINIRNVRYDIEKINDYLSLKHLSLIAKKARGSLVFPPDVDIESLRSSSFIYTSQERCELMLLMLLFDHKRLNLNRLSDTFQISRTSIHNDFLILEKALRKVNVEIIYKKYFEINHSNVVTVNIMNRELTSFFHLLEQQKDNLNPYERLALDIITSGFKGISLSETMRWINTLTESFHCEFHDDEYHWYIANLLLLVWHMKNDIPLPEDVGFYPFPSDTRFANECKALESLIGQPLAPKYRGAFIHLLEYMLHDEGLSERLDMLEIQMIIDQLIDAMSKRLHIDFSKDAILLQDLIRHVTPLIKRTFVHLKVYFRSNVTIPTRNQYVLEMLKDVIQYIPVLRTIETKEELVYLAIYFIASMGRLQISYRRILIVCNHGYGTSALLRNHLMSEFKVQVIDVIPHYKLSQFQDMEEVDYIISTIPLKHMQDKKVIVVNPILTNYDYENLTELGFERKNTLFNYNVLHQKLNFLQDHDRRKVLELLQNELDYPMTTVVPKTTYRVSDFVKESRTLVKDEEMSWKEAILDSASLLMNDGMVGQYYGKNILRDIEKLGFYCVTDGYFALFHGKDGDDVSQSAMSLIVNKQDVYFDEKKVNIILCLASKDKKDQIPVMMLLMRMVKKTALLSLLEQAKTSSEVISIIQRCESEVLT